MGNPNKHTRPAKYVFCLILTTLLFLLSVCAVAAENSINTPMLGSDYSANSQTGQSSPADKNNTRNNGRNAAEAVTDAANAVGEAVSDASNAVGDIVGDIGHAAGEVVSDAGNAVENAADAIGGAIAGTPSADGAPGNAMPFETQNAADAGGPVSGSTTTTEKTPAGVNWILILILIAAAAAIFFLLLMPKREREM